MLSRGRRTGRLPGVTVRTIRGLSIALLVSVTSFAEAGNLVRNGTFDDASGAPFITTFVPPASGTAQAVAGAMCVTITTAGVDPWDATLRQRGLSLKKGHAYALSFKAHASRATKIAATLRLVGPPYDVYWTKEIVLGEPSQTITAPLTMAVDDPQAELAFHLGGGLAAGPLPVRVCIADVSLDDPQFTTPPPPPKIVVPKVIVDPLGYYSNASKRAIVKSASKSPLPWKLIDEAGATLASGKTTVFGDDTASGESLHQIDFSARTAPGKGLSIVVGADASSKFAIGAPYGSLKYDALAFFYHQRSGVPIEASLVGEKWARKAGHPGDVKVPCGAQSGCTYSLDVHGGWYDAGDHGKYVVNGGISTWMLLAYYERTKHLGGAIGELGDGKLKIPESSNGVPDVLDEARFELEFLMRMQVPAGSPLAGMAHHKVHDDKWTPLPTAPDKDETPRSLHAPSTAATLNLAAVGAQCARVYKPFDAAFAAKCLDAAERAFVAAKANPAKYALPTDGVGGGAYEDVDVSDEFYWAAAELFVTTGKATYRDEVTKSKHFKSVPGGPNGPTASMTWQTTQALGTISLAIVPSTLPKADVDGARAAIVAAAEQYLKVIAAQGYRTPVRNGPYPWGSNSLVLDDALILTLAHDLSHDARLLEGARDAMSYIMGRNPLAQTYVTGYGANPLRNPHHRFWANQLDGNFPPPPPGLVSGGPNSGIEDPYAKGLLLGCAPEKCFVDHMESYSTNEVAINWNAPLAWVAWFLDERAADPAKVK